MKNINKIAWSIVLASFFIAGAIYFKPSSNPKETLQQTTILKAELPLNTWNVLFSVINRNSNKLAYVNRADTIELRKSIDSIAMATKTIVDNISDSARNPILKVK